MPLDFYDLEPPVTPDGQPCPHGLTIRMLPTSDATLVAAVHVCEHVSAMDILRMLDGPLPLVIDGARAQALSRLSASN